MEKRQLGTTNVAVSRLGLGCVTFGREIDEAASFRVLDAAVERGITLLDTAEAYGGGEQHSSEKIIGRWLKARGCRDEVVLQTKVTTDFSRAHVAAALDASLQRLQTDRIDFYLLHSFDPGTPLEETLESMTAALRSGKVGAVGCSNFSADQLRTALALSREKGLARLEVIQPRYSLVSRGIEAELLPLCREEHIGVVSYSPLAAGFLSGKYTPDRGRIPKGSRFDVRPGHADLYFSDQNFDIVERLRAEADAAAVPMTCLALAWVLRNPDITSVLVGATSTQHLDNAVRALDLADSSSNMEHE